MVTIISVTSDTSGATTRSVKRKKGRVTGTQIQIRVAGVRRMKGVAQKLRKLGFPRSVIRTSTQWDHQVVATLRPGGRTSP